MRGLEAAARMIGSATQLSAPLVIQQHKDAEFDKGIIAQPIKAAMSRRSGCVEGARDQRGMNKEAKRKAFTQGSMRRAREKRRAKTR